MEAGAEPEPGAAHPKCHQGMSHDVISAEGEGRCVGPCSGDTITAMSSCVCTLCESLVRLRAAEPGPRSALPASQAVHGPLLFLSVEY